jgi:hypothetical protein
MKRICMILAGLGFTVLATGGCASRPVHARFDETPADTLATSSIDDPAAPAQLGAGDQLGSTIYVRYLASIREDQGERYATGASDAPETD